MGATLSCRGAAIRFVRVHVALVVFCGVTLADPSPADPSLAEASSPRATSNAQELRTLRVDRLDFEPADYASLVGADARRQLVLTARGGDGRTLDVTHLVKFHSEPAGVVDIDATGLVTPLADGSAVVHARLPGTTLRSELRFEVDRFADPTPVNFPRQIVPVFTKFGCNGGGCHGKSGGQNGFRLSLLGFYGDEDYEFLVKESRGRRLNPAAPDHSLLLRKATGEVAHGGGARIKRDSYEYRLLRRWISQGMPYGSPDDPRVTRVEVIPSDRTLGRRSRQQIAVFAHYSDGAVEDVTRTAQFESNNAEMADVTEDGVVTTTDLPGDVAIMVRFQGLVGVFRGTVPLGAEIEQLPEPAGEIDRHVFAKLAKLGVPPSDSSSDATFLRRLSVDLIGRLPTAAEARAFLADSSPEKRTGLIEKLLSGAEYADHFANKWSAILRNRKGNGKHTRSTIAFHDWIRTSLHENLPYDDFVRGIVAASGDVDHHPPVAWYRNVNTVEEQVEDTAQLFLGMRLQCARCHHHPFEVWSQRDYYSFAAFFSRVGKKNGRNGLSANDEPAIFHNRGVAQAKNPRSGEMLRPAGLGADSLQLGRDDDPRQALVDWFSKPDNPFFARALVNRYWKHFFGRGIVEPEDDLRVTNPASHPELLRTLADGFVASGFDIKQLVRTIVNSKTYQLSSLPNDHNARDRQNFSRYYPKRLTAETLYDGLHQVAGGTPTFPGLPEGTRAVQVPDMGMDNYFLKVFGKPKGESSCECERSQEASLAQSLHLLNSKEIQQLIASDTGRAAVLAKDGKRTLDERLTELYLWAFARPPQQGELDVARAHVEKAGADAKKTREAFEDVAWALLNTKEFLFNH